MYRRDWSVNVIRLDEVETILDEWSDSQVPLFRQAHPITTSFCSAGRMLEAAVKLETLRAAASRDSLVGDEKQTAKRSRSG